jgi:hypothetical protein
VSFPFPLGALPYDQGGEQAAHAARPAGQHPTFLHITDGTVHEVHVLDLLIPEAGAFYVMDRGYLDFGRFTRLDAAGAFFVTRSKRNVRFTRLESVDVDVNGR